MNETALAPKTDTTPDVARMVIVMKSGLTFWVTKETGDRAQSHLEKQSAHSFMRIAELGETINTAEIEGVYSPGRYDELQRTQAGEYKCQWGKWHTKKEKCDCQAEARKRHQQQQEEAARTTPDETPEMRLARLERFKKMSEMAALDGGQIFRSRFLKGAKSGSRMRRSTILEWQETNGRDADITDLNIDEDSI